ncbi:immunity 63 family protein [Paenibacillus thiaminolyticus]|uniref:Immunity 63 family protein n=1 Tax=Paenibacillus thiaminolyticus TaxID=49283 RepID=A0AAP9DQF4_PANTH|nr:Imm63 family immunity protein [Paenibacillus thiaminolyticus]MCY9536737.1 immunity 63 family protein [Paenibacillus thiaminolyticus]MCY9600536.1 immunity 63 family protein [Paenibacillus thiaminolyticus]MCY9606583.1 immunity 63 family protein [Paenibacillus thiaminolyticus]MCY9614858.1 immunity 63 family protein [Paenibacillus thiaminolyticus]MCY9619849.1 immunity 63 family protein [Paenibacillus thiaminolyticus]
MMHKEQEITARIIRLLQHTSIYDDSYENMVTQPFQQDYIGDLSPCVRIRDHAYELVMYERGVQMLRKSTKNVDDVIYWILEDTVSTIAHVKLLHKYKADNVNTRLRYTKEIIQELTSTVNQAFHDIGGIYEEWHKAGRRRELESNRSL